MLSPREAGALRRWLPWVPGVSARCSVQYCLCRATAQFRAAGTTPWLQTLKAAGGGHWRLRCSAAGRGARVGPSVRPSAPRLVCSDPIHTQRRPRHRAGGHGGEGGRRLLPCGHPAAGLRPKSEAKDQVWSEGSSGCPLGPGKSAETGHRLEAVRPGPSLLKTPQPSCWAGLAPLNPSLCQASLTGSAFSSLELAPEPDAPLHLWQRGCGGLPEEMAPRSQ